MRISAFLENIGQAAKENGIPLPELLAQLRQEGLETVYASYSWSIRANEKVLIPAMEAIDLKLEGLWDNIPFHTMTEEEADAAIKGLVDCAARNGAKHVLITPGPFRQWGDDTPLTREEVAQREPELQKLIAGMRRAKAYGDSVGVAVTMEDYDVFKSPVVFPEILRRFFEEIPGLQCSFDTGNFVPCGADVMEEFRYYRDKIAAIHLKDRVENDDQNGTETAPYITMDGRKFYSAVVGSGDMHIPEIIREMNRIGYTGCGIAEFFGSTDMKNKLVESVRWLKAHGQDC